MKKLFVTALLLTGLVAGPAHAVTFFSQLDTSPTDADVFNTGVIGALNLGSATTGGPGSATTVMVNGVNFVAAGTGGALFDHTLGNATVGQLNVTVLDTGDFPAFDASSVAGSVDTVLSSVLTAEGVSTDFTFNFTDLNIGEYYTLQVFLASGAQGNREVEFLQGATSLLTWDNGTQGESIATFSFTADQATETLTLQNGPGDIGNDDPILSGYLFANDPTPPPPPNPSLFTTSGPGSGAGVYDTGVIGGEFVTGSEATEVTKLGFYDHDSDGFLDPHTVAIWDVRTETIIAQTTLSVGDDDELIGDYRYATLASPVTLDPDTEYRIVATVISPQVGDMVGDVYLQATSTGGFPNLASLPGLDSEFSEYTFGRGRFFTSADPDVPNINDFPTGTTGIASTILGPVNFIGSTVPALSGLATAVPEPTSGLLFVSALAIAGIWRRRGRSSLDVRVGTLGAALVIMLLMSPTANATHGGTPAGFTNAGSEFTVGDSTADLQALFDTGVDIYIPNMGSAPADAWVLGKMLLDFNNNDNQTIRFEEGVVVEALVGAFPLNNDSLFTIDRALNLRLEGYGATFSMKNIDPVTGGTPDPLESRHAIRIEGAVNLEIAGLTINDAAGDGIYLSGSSVAQSQVGFSRNVTIEDVVIDSAFRNGISVISVQGLLIDDTVIINTGMQAGTPAGTSPSAGIDFEPSARTQRIVDATVRNTVIVANGNDGILFAVREGSQAKPISGLIENVTVAGNSRYGFALDGNNALPAGGALPNFVIKDSLVVNNDDGGLRVVAGAGTQTIEHSAFFGNTGGGDLVGAAAFGTGTNTGTAPMFVNTTDPTSPLFYALDPSTSTLISLGDSDGSFIGARGVAGDFDADAGIDGFDFLAWQRGESPNNGSAGDLAAWEMFFGATGAPLSGLAASVGAVPEPSTAVLLSLALAGLAVTRRRRK